MLWRALVTFSSAVGAAFIAYVGYLALDSPSLDTRRGRIRQLEVQIEETAELAKKVRAVEDRQEDFQAEEERLQLELAELATMLPGTVVPENEIIALEELTAKQGLVASDFEARPRRNFDFYSTTEVNFVLVGATAEQIDQLVALIDKSRQVQKVVELEVSTRLNRAWVTVALYEYRDPG